MARVELIERIRQGLFFLDGAMGTELIAGGVEPGTCNDYLNITSPETIGNVHAAYFEAGSDAVITNTFGANKYVLVRHGHAEKVGEINLAAAQIARKAAGKDKYVLGDIGPCGDFLEPLGAVKADELKTAFAVQVKALGDGGVDGFIIETMTAIEEIQAAIEAVKSVSKLPIFASLAYDAAGDGFKTMMGVDPAGAVERLGDSGIAVLLLKAVDSFCLPKPTPVGQNWLTAGRYIRFRPAILPMPALRFSLPVRPLLAAAAGRVRRISGRWSSGSANKRS